MNRMADRQRDRTREKACHGCGETAVKRERQRKRRHERKESKNKKNAGDQIRVNAPATYGMT